MRNLVQYCFKMAITIFLVCCIRGFSLIKMNEEQLKLMEWRALQSLAKENGIKANTKKTEMIQAILVKVAVNRVG